MTWHVSLRPRPGLRGRAPALARLVAAPPPILAERRAAGQTFFLTCYVSADADNWPAPSGGRAHRQPTEGPLADKSTTLILAALSRAAASPDGAPLFAA